MPLEIVKEGAGVLRKKARPVKLINSPIHRLIDDMLETMKATNGIGLAAPQVGVSKRIIVANTGEGTYEIINPEILSAEGTEVGIEGCLSVPGWVGEVERSKSVRVTGLNREGRQVWLDGSGLLARVLQHEIDHLDGVLFMDKALSIMEQEALEEERVGGEKVGEGNAADEQATKDDVAQQQTHETEHARFRIVYMGTPEFAVKPLASLLDAAHEISMVVTQPSKRGNRGRVEEPALKVFALSFGVCVEQPMSVKDPAFVEKVRSLEPDFIVVAAFGQKLPESLLAVPRYGALNIHASLLPAYRGASPIQRAIMNGDRETGVTIMKLAAKMDSGPVLAQERVPIGDDDDAGSLAASLAEAGARLLAQVLGEVADSRIESVAQDDKAATYAPRIGSGEEVIDWSRPACDVVNKIRALSPKPGARSWFKGKVVKIWRAVVGTSEDTPLAVARPGAVCITGRGDLSVRTGRGTIRIIDIQPAGKRRMTGAEFIRGYRPAPGAAFLEHDDVSQEEGEQKCSTSTQAI
jgi:methionyl-tRNA formyltransferase